jgi:hypothetical protein
VQFILATHSNKANSCELARFEYSKARIALCFFGLVKNTSIEHVKNYKINIVQPLKDAGLEVGAFMHTYHVPHIANKRNGENDDIDLALALKTWKTLNLSFFHVKISETIDADSRYPVDSFIHAGDPWPDNPKSSLTFYLRQIYSLLNVTSQLEKRKDEFVGAIYLRPDVRFLDALNVHLLCSIMNNRNRSVVALPSWESYGGANDRFAFGKTDDMISYGERGNELRHYVHVKKQPPHAETFLLHYLQSKNISILPISQRFQRIRANGKVEYRDANL